MARVVIGRLLNFFTVLRFWRIVGIDISCLVGLHRIGCVEFV